MPPYFCLISAPFKIGLLAPLVVMHPSWGGGTPLLSSAYIRRQACLLLLFLAVATLGSGLPSPTAAVVVVVSNFGDEGSHAFACICWQACFIWPLVRDRWPGPPSAAGWHSLPPLEGLPTLSPPLCSSHVFAVGVDGSRGHNSLPPLCAASLA